MKKFSLLLCLSLTAFTLTAQAQVAPTEDSDQLSMLESSDPQLAKNKKLVFDFWRIIYEGGHMDRAPEFMTEGYIQHNPNVVSGRASFIEVFTEVRPPITVQDKMKVRVIDIVAEDDTVVVSFVRKVASRENPELTYDMTWFDVFRIEDNLIAEHWDPSELWVNGKPPGAEFKDYR